MFQLKQCAISFLSSASHRIYCACSVLSANKWIYNEKYVLQFANEFPEM